MKKILVILTVVFLPLLSVQVAYSSSAINIDGKFSDWDNKYILSSNKIKYSFNRQGKYRYIYVSSPGELPRKYKISSGEDYSVIKLTDPSRLHRKGVHMVTYELSDNDHHRKKVRNHAYVRISHHLKKLELQVPNNGRISGQSTTTKMAILDRNKLRVISGGVSTYPFYLVATGFTIAFVHVIFRKRRHSNE